MPHEPTALPTQPNFSALLANLDRQSDLYDQLYALSERERAAIGDADLPALVALIEAKERIVTEAQTLERQREALCRHFARLHGMERPPTIHEIGGWADSPGSLARLRAVSLQLSARVQRLRQVNTRNAHIITQAQRMNDQLLAAALRHAQHPLYTPQGDAAPNQRPSIILDYKV
jgi:flagellar biosynthesis/type III secretory pathway chaperone